MIHTVQAQCEQCGLIYDQKCSGSEIRCPECGFREFVGDKPLSRKRNNCNKCLSCPFSIDVCQECQHSIPWETDIPHFEQPIKPKDDRPVFTTQRKVNPPPRPEVSQEAERAGEGEIRVYIKHIGYAPMMKMPYRYLYTGRAAATTEVRAFSDPNYYKTGWYNLPENEWGKGTYQFDADCDACGTQFPAMGRAGTKIECPMCGTEDVIMEVVE